MVIVSHTSPGRPGVVGVGPVNGGKVTNTLQTAWDHPPSMTLLLIFMTFPETI